VSAPLYLESVSQCPVCDSPKIEFGFVIHYWKENPLRFFICKNCALHFANPMPADRLIADGNNALVKWYGKDREFSHEFRDARQAYLRGRMLAGKLKRWKKKGKLLDIGCNNGFLPLGIRDFSAWEVEGLEISSTMAEFVQSKLGIPTHCGTLETANLPSDTYDFIICHDIIEHVNQPKVFLSELARVLKPGGRLQIITPNAIQDLAFSKRAAKAGMPMTMLLNHINYFSPKALWIALQSHGLKTKTLFCYDIRYAMKDFGLFGLNRPQNVRLGPEMALALALPDKDTLSQWTASRIEELRKHPKVSARYGFFRETLPKFFTIPVPPGLKIGHEIYALAEKTQQG
jgi:2-polyprenyl-3-methyl-5-hydroxy-6-metoxy-1,4-benzoquinol methylase